MKDSPTLPPALSRDHPCADYRVGHLTLRYLWQASRDRVELLLFPTRREADLVARRGQEPVHPATARYGTGMLRGDVIHDSLVQVHRRGDGLGFPTSCNSWAAGHTLRNSETTDLLSFREQVAEQPSADHLEVLTTLATPDGLIARHRLRWDARQPDGVTISIEVANEGETPFVLEHLASFSLGKLSPFARDDMPGRLRLHRFRSAWSMEGRHDVQPLEALHLERFWGEGGANQLRYGQVGSLPVRGFFPFIGLEDTAAGVLWGAQLAWHGSWQMEVYRRDDPVVLAGGLADYDLGQWARTLRPGERFTAPTALVSCAEGGIDELCQNLVGLQESLSHPEPAAEKHLPIIFNEWCSSWGHPTHENVLATGRKLQETETEIFVIDDGWALRPEGTFQCNGDWIVHPTSFPQGLRATTGALAELGLRTGLWFELEVATRGSAAFAETDHHLHRHGHILQVGQRRFWDLRDPWTRDYLRGKVIQQLKEGGFKYLKVDYNDSIGLGCAPLGDDSAGLGEGLRQHLCAVHEFFLEIRRAIPDLTIENCASGGHRLEPGFVGLTSMSSFSDAHEGVEIPIIAASLHRLIPARKNQVWIVLRPHDDARRLNYGFASTFLGRMAVSGDLVALSEESFSRVKEAQAFYRRVHHLIRDGRSWLDQSGLGDSYRYPRGWQALRRLSPAEDEVLIVAHAFAAPPAEPITVPLPPGRWKAVEALAGSPVTLEEGSCRLLLDEAFTGEVLHLRRVR